jgi:biotin operon repressor
MAMRWTPEKVEELRGLAHLGGRALGERLGIARTAVNKKAQSLGVHIGPVRLGHDGALRAGGMGICRG